MTGPVVLVVGSLHHDILVEADRLPGRDETAVGRRWYPKFGGKGGNQAVAARRAGATVRMVGAVGADAFGAFLLDRLAAEGVDHARVARHPAAASGMSVAIQDAAGDYAAAIVSGANRLIDPAALGDPALWAGAGLLVLQNEVPAPVNLAAAVAARGRGVPVLLNAAPARDLDPGLRAGVDILVVNAVEAAMMGAGAVGDLGEAAEAARRLARAFGTAIVTAGARGLAACAPGRAFALPAEPVRAVSAHGAGDAFVGALAAALAGGADLEAACRAGARAGARHVAAPAQP